MANYIIFIFANKTESSDIMKPKNSNKIIIAVLLFLAYLIESPLRSRFVSYFSNASEFSFNWGYLFTAVIGYIAIFVCLLIAVKPFVNTPNFFKAFSTVFVFMLIDIIVLENCYGVVFSLVYQVVRILVVVAILLLAFRFITKGRIKVYKHFIISVGCGLLVGAVFNALDYIRSLAFDVIINSSENVFFSSLLMLTYKQSTYSILANAVFYTVVYLTLLLIMRSLPPVTENNVAGVDDIIEPDNESEIPEGTWKCMGCGKQVVEEKDRCDCGYKR